MNARGFSLTELMIVIGLIGIMLAMVSLNFRDWLQKYNIENQAREMVADLSSLRIQAIQTKSNQVAVLSANPKLMTFRSYTSEEPVTLTTGRETFRKYFKYSVITRKSDGTLVPCYDVGFNIRGYTNDFQPSTGGGTFQSNQTILVQPTGTNASTDCLVITDTRINVGKYDGSNCVYK